MSNDPNTFSSATPPPSRMDPGLAALLRKAADGELAYEEMVALRMYMDTNAMAEDRVEFERQLRSACRRTMADVRAPDALRDRVQSMLEASRRGESEESRASGTIDVHAPVIARRVNMRSVEQGPYRYIGWLWTFRNLAAAIALLAAGFMVAKVIDTTSRLSVRPEPDAADRVVRADMAGYLSSAFAAVGSSSPDAMAAKVQFMSLQRTLGVAEEWLQQVPITPSGDDAGVIFAGGVQATMPGAGKAFHFRYRVAKPDDLSKSELVSVFVQQDRLEMPLRQDITYTFLGPLDTVTWVSRRDGLVYYILAESRWAVRRLTRALQLPEASDAIKSMP